MKSFFAIVLLLAFSAALVAQKSESGKPAFKKLAVVGADLNGPVTDSEAASVFQTTRKAFKESRISVAAKTSISESGKPVTRDAVILEMSKIFEASKKAIHYVPIPVKYDANVLKVGGGAKAPLEKLITWGFVAPIGPLATGPKQTLTLKEFGDALGFFITRMSEVTHTPSSRWSPYLNSGSDD